MRCVKTIAYLATALIGLGLEACDEGRIYNVSHVEEPATGEELTLMQAVQRRVFDAHCTQCHGGSNHAAAGLYLTEGLSRENLVGKPSSVMQGATLLVPGNHASSLLYQTVATDVSTPWAYSHNHLLNESEKYLLSTWIDLEQE